MGRRCRGAGATCPWAGLFSGLQRRGRRAGRDRVACSLFVTARRRNPNVRLTRSCSDCAFADRGARIGPSGRVGARARLARRAREGRARVHRDLAPAGILVRLRRVLERVRGSFHVLCTRRSGPPLRASPPRAPRPRRAPHRPRGLRPRAQVGGAGVSVAVLLPDAGASPLGRGGPVPEDGRGADPAVPRGRGGAPARGPLPHLGHRGRQGAHGGERSRGPSPVLRQVGAGRGVRRRVDPAGSGPARSAVPRHGGPERAGRGGFGRRHHRCISGARSRSARRGSAARAPRWGPCPGAGPPKGPPPRRGACPRQHDRLAAAPREARRGAGRALPLPPGRLRGDDPRARSRPHPRAAGEAARAGEEAAQDRAGRG